MFKNGEDSRGPLETKSKEQFFACALKNACFHILPPTLAAYFSASD